MRDGSYRKYYYCSSRDSGCPAKYYVDILGNGNKNTLYQPPKHNHEPPANPRVRAEVKEAIKSQLLIGGKTSVIHRKMVNEAPLPISSADVPSLKQMYNWKYQLSIKDLPSGTLSLPFCISISIFFYF